MEVSQLFYYSEFTWVLVNRSWKHSDLQIAENYWQIWKQLSNANSANSQGFFPCSSIGLEQQGKRWTSSLGKLTASPSYFRKKRHLSQKLVTDFSCDSEIWHLCWDGKNPACLNIIPNIRRVWTLAHLVGVNVCTCSARWHNTHASTWQHKGPQEVQFIGEENRRYPTKSWPAFFEKPALKSYIYDAVKSSIKSWRKSQVHWFHPYEPLNI